MTMTNAHANELPKRISAVVVLVAVAAILAVEPALAQWPQWGGPDRNFVVETSGLADKWPEGGPKRLWHRVLGSGYSSIVVDEGVLYTMYRQKKTSTYENTIALDAATGETIWRKRNLAPVPRSGMDSERRDFCGPNATPLVVGDRLYTIGRNVVMHCHRKTDGTVLWKHDLVKDFGAQIPTWGYSSSPIAFGQTVIVPVGRTANSHDQGKSLVAFDQATGEVVWRDQTFRVGHSSPVLINFEGEDQLVLYTMEGIIGVNPVNGKLLWEHAFPHELDHNVIVTPAWDGVDHIVLASADVGCGVKLFKEDGKMAVTESWSSRKIYFGTGTPVLIGGVFIGSKGGGMDAPLVAADVGTGKRRWFERVFPMATAVYGDGKLILLDHTGQLGLATATAEGLTVHSRCQITEKWSFTPPTLVGTMLYIRDEKHVMALDLRKT